MKPSSKDTAIAIITMAMVSVSVTFQFTRTALNWRKLGIILRWKVMGIFGFSIQR
jgi:hypothetical protein